MVAKRILEQLIEVGGDDHSHVATSCESGNYTMGCRRCLQPLVLFRVGWLEVATQPLAPLVGRLRDLLKKVCVVWINPEFASVPRFQFGRRHGRTLRRHLP